MEHLRRYRPTMIFYHGGPITPQTCAYTVWHAGHAMVSWVNPVQIELAAAVSQSFALDNGAFTLWRQGGEVDWRDYYAWAGEWLAHPACDWALIPDVIEGTEDENDALIDEWPHGPRGVPVWHLNESVERLEKLAMFWPRIALGSADEYDVSRPKACVNRLAETLPAICDEAGRPRVKLHGLRMLNSEVITRIPLASGDSTNIARNIGIDMAWYGSYTPITKELRAQVLKERMEMHHVPATLTEIPWPKDATLSIWGDDE